MKSFGAGADGKEPGTPPYGTSSPCCTAISSELDTCSYTIHTKKQGKIKNRARSADRLGGAEMSFKIKL